MSRSYYEWMEAKHKWYVNQVTRIASIPVPPQELTYPIVYKREPNNPYWEKRYNSALNYISVKQTINFKLENIKSFITEAAEYERKKETDFLNKFYKGQKSSDSYIDKFNILFQSRERYESFNKRIQHILNTKQYQQNKDQSRNEYYTGMAPNLMSVFTTYFSKHFEAAISRQYSNINPSMSNSQLAALCDNAIREAILTASEEMANISVENANEYGHGEEWEPIYDMLKSDKNSLDMFTNTLKEAIGMHNFETLMRSLQGQKAQKQRLSQKRMAETIFKDLANIKGRTASIGGSIVEPVISIILNSLHGSAKANGLGYNVEARNFGGNSMMTDAMQLWTTNLNINLTQVMDELYDAMNSEDSAHIREVYKQISAYEAMNPMEEVYQVFVNAKNYGLGANGRNYTKSYSGDFEELPSFLQANGIDVGKAQDFLTFAYNTGEGAKNEGYRASFMEECVNALKAMAANIMFDDYETMGRGEGNMVHMYYLSGKYIPASVVLQATADAIDEARENTRAEITLPGPIQDAPRPYRRPQWDSILGTGGEHDAEFKEALWAHWKEESDKARAASTWSVSFTLRIKELVGMK